MQLLAFLLISLSSIAATSSPWDIEKIKKDPKGNQPDVIRLKNSTQIELGTYLTRFVGRIENKSGAPALLFEGMPCVECDADSVLFVYSVAGKKAYEFMYPGKIHVQKDVLSADSKPELNYDIRMFYGDCHKSHPQSLVIFDRDEEVRVVTLQPDGELKLSEATQRPKIAKSAHCREIAGKNRSTF